MNSINSGYGFGKTILFGEHFVVYGLPSLVCALKNKTVAQILPNNDLRSGFELIDLRPKAKSFKPVLGKEYYQLIRNILNFAGIKTFIKIFLKGDLKVFSGGIGASAACAASVARSIKSFFNLNWDEQDINKAAFYGEKAVHGNPSGIDNTASVFGGAFWFEKNKIKKIKIKKPIEVVLADSSIISNTKNVLMQVKKTKEQYSYKVDMIFKDYKNLVTCAQKSIVDFDLKRVGYLMNKNHELLKRLGVSCSTLNNMVDLVLKNGALGAKLTGTGKGGLIVALTPGKYLQNKVADSLQQKGFDVLKTFIG